MLVLLALLFVGASPSNDSPLQALQQCLGLDTTREQNTCLTVQRKVAEARLQKAYDTLMSRLKQAGDSEFSAQVRKTERAWLLYRDAQCENEALVFKGGSFAPINAGTCHIDLTQRRAQELENLATERFQGAPPPQ